MKILLFIFAVFFMQSQMDAQDSARKASAGFLGSYAYQATVFENESAKLLDQRFGNFQAYFLLPVGKNQDLGFHFSQYQYSFEMRDLNQATLVRQKAIGLGAMHRFYHKVFFKDLQLFFQTTADFDILRKRELGSGDPVLFQGTGIHLFVRPALRYTLNASIGLELGFGAFELNSQRWWDVSGPVRQNALIETNVSLSYNLPTLMLGFFFQM